MVLFNRIAIVGVGLIGGSLGLAIKRRRIASSVVGIGHRESSLKEALRKRAVDEVTLDLKKGVRGADLVILATPISAMAQIVRKIKGSLRPGAIVIDVGSTKKEVGSKIERLLPKGTHYVGCHPMAGSEKRGVGFADGGLFKDSLCIITPSSGTDKKALAKIKRFWLRLGACVVILERDSHDRLIAQISHLAHLAATALVAAISDSSLKYASGGFKDTTRIASSEPLLWRDICMTNRRHIIDALDRYMAVLKNIKTKIKSGKAQELKRFFEQVKNRRDKFLSRL